MAVPESVAVLLAVVVPEVDVDALPDVPELLDVVVAAVPLELEVVPDVEGDEPPAVVEVPLPVEAEPAVDPDPVVVVAGAPADSPVGAFAVGDIDVLMA